METVSLQDYCQDLGDVLKQVSITNPRGEQVQQGNGILLTLMEGLRQRKGKVILVGNGGSAALVAHMHNDLVKCDGIRALLCTETSLLTAYTNDDGYETAYEQQIRMWGEAEDLLIAVSSSGQSQNILNAVEAARDQNMYIVTLSGFDSENPLRTGGDLNYYIPSQSYGFVELSHSIIGHYLTDCLALQKKATGVLV